MLKIRYVRQVFYVDSRIRLVMCLTMAQHVIEPLESLSRSLTSAQQLLEC